MAVRVFMCAFRGELIICRSKSEGRSRKAVATREVNVIKAKLAGTYVEPRRRPRVAPYNWAMREYLYGMFSDDDDYSSFEDAYGYLQW